ncbi:MAG: hypothetical protein HZY78_07205 [Burkholderiaceae bacterium]|nr:MAG: hypothetical protein HZY78_07205 [Burkholderiaceae bacterium]
MAVDPSANAPSAMKRGQFVLVGVLVSPATSAALLRDAETGKTETVVLGGQVRGLTLAEVNAERAVLRLGAEFEELRLALQRGAGGRVNAGGAASVPAAALPQPTASQPVIEGVIPPTVPVPPTPAQPYSNGLAWGLEPARVPAPPQTPGASGPLQVLRPVPRVDHHLAQTDRPVFEEVS